MVRIRAAPESSYPVSLCLALRLGLGKNSTIQDDYGPNIIEFGFKTGNAALYWVEEGAGGGSRACSDETAPLNETAAVRVGNNLDVGMVQAIRQL